MKEGGSAVGGPERIRRRREGCGTPRFRGDVAAFVAMSICAVVPSAAAAAGEGGHATMGVRNAPAAEEKAPGPLARQAVAARVALSGAGLERTEVETTGRTLVVWRGGAGPHLILLHGSGQQAGAWAKVAPALLAELTVHVLDLPGHGESEPAEGPLRMADVVAGVEAYLLSLDGPAILVGNSLGAWLATLQSHRHPVRVARAVLVDGGALLNVPAEGLSLVPADREAARRVMAAVRDPASPQLTDEELDELVGRSDGGPTARMLQDVPGLMAHLLDGRLGEVTVPVDVVWGASDRLVPLDYARRMVGELPRARLTVIERCGHIPPTECPERFLAVLRELLESPPPQPAPAESEAGAVDGADGVEPNPPDGSSGGEAVP